MPRSRTSDVDPAQMPLLGFVEYVWAGDNTFRAVQRPPVRMTSLTRAAKASGVSRDIIYRLYKTGFIEGDHSSPGKIMVNLQSVQTHFEQSRDPEYWTEARKRQYRGR